MIREELLAIDRFICEVNNFESVYYHHRFAEKDIYVPRFIVEANWSCNVEHMIDKWHEAQRKSDSYGWFSAFYCEMDENNKEAMVEWILNNRKHGYIRG